MNTITKRKGQGSQRSRFKRHFKHIYLRLNTSIDQLPKALDACHFQQEHFIIDFVNLKIIVVHLNGSARGGASSAQISLRESRREFERSINQCNGRKHLHKLLNFVHRVCRLLVAVLTQQRA